MTERIYYRDAYAAEFSARVISRSPDGKRIKLDRSAFYPTSGGQQFDTGVLNETRVIDVIDEEDNIIHLLSAPLAADEVIGRLDWPRRYDHMQQHTGQHVLSAVFEDRFGYGTASVHFGVESSSIDLETQQLSREQVLETEARANAIVQENRPVVVSFENAATALGLRKPPPREGELRVITIDGVDRSACGGTHVRSTGEVGPVLLRKQDRMHGNVRIEFLCGGRALKQARADYEALARAAAALGTSAGELPDRATALQTDLRAAERTRRKLGEELAVFRANREYRKAQADARNVRWIIERLATGSLDDLRALAHAATALQRAAFIGVVLNPPQLLFATSEDTGIDAGKALKAALATAGGRGGGSARIAQGTVPPDAIDTAIATLAGGMPPITG